jgi:cytochrome c oxidase cbb3-type subunit 3
MSDIRSPSDSPTTPGGDGQDRGAPTGRLLDHEYDGIREYDNPLPKWWLYIFYVTILVVPWYYLNPGGLGSGPPRTVAYEQEMAAARARQPAVAPSSGMTEEALAARAGDRATLELGKATFATNCAVCHRPDAGGLIGPNLTDDFWLHGGTHLAILTTVTDGVLDKGMPAWGKLLKPEQVTAVAVYVSTLRGTNPPNPKPPQGTKAGAP